MHCTLLGCIKIIWHQFSSVALLCPTLCDPMNRSTPGLPVHHHLLEFTQTQRPSSRWCHPAISSSVVPFSSCSQSLPASGSFPMSQLFTWGGQSIGVSASASVLLMNTQDWSLGWTGWISLQSKGLSRVFSNISGLYIVGITALIAWGNEKQWIDPALDKWNYLIKTD